MTSWRSLGHRGDATEDIINATNKYYELHEVAIVNKMPVPIKVIEIESSIIKKAFFEEKSTVDYYGIVQGIPIVFDAKETEKKSLPLQNIHLHQIEYMKKVRKQNGLAFLIVHFKYYGEFILIPIEIIDYYYEKSFNGGRKSIPYLELDKNFIIEFKNGILHYLDTLNVYLEYIDKNKFAKYL
ncbi:Holliday junction resolvase RecU [Caminicella sporogenes]|uniref:Holliday junction resolvase RecU n=1 Tax=Caminicella sporogenes TaxID=166485 RepID=UPI0025421494|nr:Holliday junction resolvase RecU [Caminicella sporogenes]WIF94151.1 Holliday junction resolvase RecU [Caminicella sporogenes]